MLQITEDNKQVIQAPKNILIVDDDQDCRWLLTSLFNLRGYQAHSVSSGNEAITWIENFKPDVIILDVMMPDMDGWETFQQLRGRTDLPVLFLTALSSHTNTTDLLWGGINDIMYKPFHSDELIARVEALLISAQNLHPISSVHTPKRVYKTRPTVSVIMPTLNEAKNLPLILPFLPMSVITEVILVDGRSTDGTVEVARKIMPAIKVVMEKKHGKGAALLAGYRASSGDIIVVMDADGSNDPREIPRFIHSLTQGADFVKGSRFAPGGGTTDMPRIRRLGNAGFVYLVNLLFNSTYTDLCYGYHAFWRYCLSTMELENVDGFEIDATLYLRAINDKLKISEVPSFEGYRFYGEGKLRTFPDGLRVLRTIMKEYLRSILQPCHDLQMGFREESVRDEDSYAISNTTESYPTG
jgi:CheY-like chemotaxis protein